MNKTGILRFQATKVGKDTALAQIIGLVEDALSFKAPVQRLADIVSGYFTCHHFNGDSISTGMVFPLECRSHIFINGIHRGVNCRLPLCFGTCYSDSNNGWCRERR